MSKCKNHKLQKQKKVRAHIHNKNKIFVWYVKCINLNKIRYRILVILVIFTQKAVVRKFVYCMKIQNFVGKHLEIDENFNVLIE